MIAAIHLQEVLALQAVSSVIALHALFVLPGFFAASWAIADAPTSRTATAADAPNSFALALTSLSPDSSSRKDVIARLEAKNNCGCGAPQPRHCAGSQQADNFFFAVFFGLARQ